MNATAKVLRTKADRLIPTWAPAATKQLPNPLSSIQMATRVPLIFVKFALSFPYQILIAIFPGDHDHGDSSSRQLAIAGYLQVSNQGYPGRNGVRTSDLNEAQKIIDIFIQSGNNELDTARMYAGT